MPKRVRPASELTSEEKVKLMNWFVQADPVLKFETEIVAGCIEDITFERFIPVTPKREDTTTSRKWVVKFYKRIWGEGKFISATPQQINFKHMMETCTIRGRGMKMKQIEIRNSDRPKKRKAWIPNTIDIPDYVDESEADEGDGDGQEEIAEGGTGGIDSESVEYYEKDGSLATDESEKKNSNDGSGQKETKEEQVGDEESNDDTNDDNVDDYGTSSTEADNQNQAIDKQNIQPKKRGRRSPGESSSSSSGGTAQVERSSMSELALKKRMKSSKKKLKTGNEQDGEQDVELETARKRLEKTLEFRDCEEVDDSNGTSSKGFLDTAFQGLIHLLP
ncbi:uncharacterized protein EAE97_003749 [Botrytis byssoidea]|uniref:Uncharacterized protein n=1 Tax=Botrytis byssoidea TaxID=139641 RepID=A0A9P5IW21_9HELO|nr:uncharacterized protein EAE97_003749 [Botrytis byssoidea]KAF7948338.1 hypothetical protein EAE97_003749 [Botrytis byssoidea]